MTISELPVWVQDIIAWFSVGSNLVSLCGIFGAFIRLGAASKNSKAVTNVQIDLLQTMISKLSDTRNLAENVQTVSKQIGDCMTQFEQALIAQKQSNANLAAFVMECFNRSNLTDEAKSELRLMADKIFYDDNTALIDALKRAKAEADAAVIEGQKQIEQLEANLADEKEKLVKAQENTKANRRL